MSTSFLLSFLKEPGMVGAILPSSGYLAQAMCRQAHGARHLVELGAGTGAVTRHLCATFPGTPLILVERDRVMASELKRRFDTCTIVAKCLHDRGDLFQDIPDETVVVSSLPFRSLPEDVAEKTVALLKGFLLENRHRKLIQYTYGRKTPFISPHPDLVWQRQELVLLNFPPAWIWTLQRTQSVCFSDAVNDWRLYSPIPGKPSSRKSPREVFASRRIDNE